MSSKSPRGDNAKKAPKLSIKEKRQAKREKDDSSILKPRKGN